MKKASKFSEPDWWNDFHVETPSTIEELWKYIKPYGTEVYRGLSDANQTLSPRVARNKGHVNSEWNMMSEFATCTRSHGHQPRNNLELLALAQHHGLPTRCMDVTSAFGVALYFASLPASHDNGAAIWCLNVSKAPNMTIKWFKKYDQRANGKLSCEYTIFPNPPTITGDKVVPIESDSEINAEIDRYMTNATKPRHPPVLVGTPHVSHRMRAQDASFILIDPIGEDLGTQLKDLGCTDILKGIYLSPKLCKDSRKHLRCLGINRRILFPDIDNLASDIAELYLKQIV